MKILVETAERKFVNISKKSVRRLQMKPQSAVAYNRRIQPRVRRFSASGSRRQFSMTLCSTRFAHEIKLANLY